MRGLGASPRYTPPGQGRWGSMKIELYRLFHWVAITALVVWMVYSAYSAFIFS